MSTPSSLPNDILLVLDKLPDGQGVSERHAAAILGLSVSKLQKDRVKGAGPRFVKNGKTKFARVTYLLGDLRHYQQAHTHQSTSTYLTNNLNLSELGLARPFAVFGSSVRGFLDSLSAEPDEIAWLSHEEAKARGWRP